MMSLPLSLPVQEEIQENASDVHSTHVSGCDEESEDIGTQSSATTLHVCRHCQAVFASASFLSRHMKRKCVREENLNNPYKCEHCPLSFKQKPQWKRHLLLHSGVRPYKCEKCDKTFLSKAHLKRHSIVHLSADDVPYKCEICGKAFAWPSLLKSHGKSHNGEKQFKCGICARMFLHASTLKLHTLNRHMVDGFFHCIVCQAKYKQVSELMEHMKTHESDQSVKCERCESCFLSLQDLETHVCVNLGGKPLLCQYCLIDFQDTESFCNHECMQVSSNRTCACCRKEFKSIWHMKEHLITHCAEKPYKCKKCNLAFRRKRELEIHLTKHGTEKQFQCEICSSLFTAKDYLKHHMRVEHRQKTHLCTICGHYFMFKSALKTHLEFHNRTGNLKFGKKNHRDNEHFVPGLAEKLDSMLKKGPVSKTSKQTSTNNKEPNSITESNELALISNSIKDANSVHLSDSLPTNTVATKKNVEISNITDEQITTESFTDSLDKASSYSTVTVSKNTPVYQLLDNATPLEKSDAAEGIPKRQEQNSIEVDPITGKTIFRCLLCLDVFATHSLLLRHQKESHCIGKEYQCDICGRFFALAANLSQHLHMHKNSKSNHKYSCRYCGNHFKVIYKLREHLRSKHNEINNQLTDLELHVQHNKDKTLFPLKSNTTQNDELAVNNLTPLNLVCLQNDGSAVLLNNLLLDQNGKVLSNIQNLGFLQLNQEIQGSNNAQLNATQLMANNMSLEAPQIMETDHRESTQINPSQVIVNDTQLDSSQVLGNSTQLQTFQITENDAQLDISQVIVNNMQLGASQVIGNNSELHSPQLIGNLLASHSDFDMNSINGGDLSYIENQIVTSNSYKDYL